MHSLQTRLERLNRNGYKLYKTLKGEFDFGDFKLSIDFVQADPFASPSKITVSVPLRKTYFPDNLYENRAKSKAFRDALGRVIFGNIRKLSTGNRGTGNSGKFVIHSGGQKILERNAVVIDGDQLRVRLLIGLPAYGRNIAADQAQEMFFGELPEIVKQSLNWRKLDPKFFNGFVNLIEKQETIRSQLEPQGLVAFIADGAVLPRSSGISDTPLSPAVKFQSPPDLRVTMNLPRGETITGMGIRHGVTLITGGGFHGKSTLLNAVQAGIYNHIPGDGREFVISDPDLVKIRAEDGRSIAGTDISTFINNLPGGKSTADFSTENASGSTSQAANIMEALEAGCGTILLDEDTSATNFLIRDKRMQELIPSGKEPITPYIDVARELYDRLGVSTLFAMGGSGDYIDVADTVIMMEDYLPRNATKQARDVAEKYPYTHIREFDRQISVPHRVIQPGSVDPSKGNRDAKISAAETGIRFGKSDIDLKWWEHITDRNQYVTIGDMLYYLVKAKHLNGKQTVADMLERLYTDVEKEGLDAIHHRCYGVWEYYCEVRKLDVAAALNRLRTLKTVG